MFWSPSVGVFSDSGRRDDPRRPFIPHAQAPHGPHKHRTWSSTFLGGSIACANCSDVRTWGLNAASDAQGNTYVTGATKVSNLPVLHAWQDKPAAHSRLSAFVAKYDPEGHLLWCTYLGGNGDNMGIGVAVTPDGGVAVAGMTEAAGSEPLPYLACLSRPEQRRDGLFRDGLRRGRDGAVLTYLGGSGVDGESDPFSDDNTNGNNVAVDAHGPSTSPALPHQAAALARSSSR